MYGFQAYSGRNSSTAWYVSQQICDIYLQAVHWLIRIHKASERDIAQRVYAGCETQKSGGFEVPG